MRYGEFAEFSVASPDAASGCRGGRVRPAWSDGVAPAGAASTTVSAAAAAPATRRRARPRLRCFLPIAPPLPVLRKGTVLDRNDSLPGSFGERLRHRRVDQQ